MLRNRRQDWLVTLPLPVIDQPHSVLTGLDGMFPGRVEVKVALHWQMWTSLVE